MAFSVFPTVWAENDPESLLNSAVAYCVKNPITFCKFSSRYGFELREGLLLPQEICERMLEVSRTQLSEEDFYKFIRIFGDSNTRLKHVNLQDTPIRNSDLVIFSRHNISELNLTGCQKLNSGALKCLVKFSGCLESLSLGSSPDLFCDDQDFAIGPWEKDNHRKRTEGEGNVSDEHLLNHCMQIWLNKEDKKNETKKLFDSLPELVTLPMLRKLVIHDLPKTKQSIAFMEVVKTSNRLTHLDLYHSKVWNFNSFVHQPLRSLVLCDVYNVDDCLPSIYQIKTLRHLDLSNTERSGVTMFENPNQVLKSIVDNLVHLISLDISGTNLAGTGTVERVHSGKKTESEDNENDAILCDIPGLASRVNRPLEFLGLLNCPHEACYRHHIPANRIAGDNGEEQILIAGQAYCAREWAIQKVLNDLFGLFRYDECKQTKLALDVIMEAMRIHLKKKSIQVAGSASLFYIVKSELKETFNVKMRKNIIKTLIDAMFAHYSDTTMLRNGCLALIHFKIPDDMFFDYERFASLLLLIVSQDDQEEFVQRIGVYLLNSLACQVDGIEKKLVGDHGAIKIMLQIIEKRLERHLCDEVMETAWSTMWNVTDETPINCARFLEGKGMDLFLQCLEAFPSKPELLRNMIGLLGNVAEVKELRCFLMKEEYLSVFSDLLDNRSDGIEVSYNAAGILSHIASDGPQLWMAHQITKVSRKTVLQRMVNAINSWDLNTKRNINYRSFKPILRLLSVHHTPEAQYWAVWALTNLTNVYPEKYCSLLEKEGGLTLLEELAQHAQDSSIYDLARSTIEHCKRYENPPDDMSESSEIDVEAI